MYERWSTAKIAPPHRARFWADALGQALGPMTPRIRSLAQFRGEIVRCTFDGWSISRLATNAIGADRTSSDVARRSERVILVQLVTAGRLRVCQGGIEVTLGSGDLVITDGALTAELDHPEGIELVALAVPARATGWEDPVPVFRPSHSAAAAMLRSQMRALAAWDGDLDASESMAIAEGLVHTLGAVMREATGTPAPKRRSRLRGKLRNLFDQRCADARFSPAVAAQELGVSVRTLHAWLALDGCRFGAELLERRLERARMMLGSGTSDRTIQEVAALCGFVSAAHLSRRFRERYGVSPSQWRARAELRPGSPPTAEPRRPVFLPVAFATGRGAAERSALPA